MISSNFADDAADFFGYDGSFFAGVGKLCQGLLRFFFLVRLGHSQQNICTDTKESRKGGKDFHVGVGDTQFPTAYRLVGDSQFFCQLLLSKSRFLPQSADVFSNG